MGRSISDRMSYRNHYMCSGEATSIIKDIIKILSKRLTFLFSIVLCCIGVIANTSGFATTHVVVSVRHPITY